MKFGGGYVCRNCFIDMSKIGIMRELIKAIRVGAGVQKSVVLSVLTFWFSTLNGFHITSKESDKI